MVEEDFSPLKVKDFVSIAFKAKELQSELEKEIAQQKKSAKEVDQAVIDKVVKLVHFITDEDYLGVARFNKITEDIRPQCLLPHQLLKVDLPMASLITRSLLEKDHSSGIYKNLNEARDQMAKLMKDGSNANRKQFETVVALLNHICMINNNMIVRLCSTSCTLENCKHEE